MKNLKLILAASLFTTLFSCINNDNYSEPDLTGECSDLTPTKTVLDVAATATTTAQQYVADDVIEAYVTSSDEGGNFYKSISSSHKCTTPILLTVAGEAYFKLSV